MTLVCGCMPASCNVSVNRVKTSGRLSHQRHFHAGCILMGSVPLHALLLWQENKGLPTDSLTKIANRCSKASRPAGPRWPKHFSDQQINDVQFRQEMYASHGSSRRRHFTFFAARSLPSAARLASIKGGKNPSRFAPSLLHLINSSLRAGL